METKDIADFYDVSAVKRQTRSFNERHFLLFEKLQQLGLSKKSNVLELGCGVGAITALMASVVTEGKIVSSDFSRASVDLARQRLAGRDQVVFVTSDLLDFSYPGVEFDFVTLFDVLEHIPAEVHDKVFASLAAHMGPRTRLFINIPSPEQLEYLIQNEPGTLQIVDQPLPADRLLGHAYANGLTLRYFETYSIWYEGDYQMMLFGRKQPFSNIRIDRREGLLSRLRRKLKWRRLGRMTRQI